MRHFTKIRLNTVNKVVSSFLPLKSKHNFRIADIFKKTDKLSVLLNYRFTATTYTKNTLERYFQK